MGKTKTKTIKTKEKCNTFLKNSDKKKCYPYKDYEKERQKEGNFREYSNTKTIENIIIFIMDFTNCKWGDYLYLLICRGVSRCNIDDGRCV